MIVAESGSVKAGQHNLRSSCHHKLVSIFTQTYTSNTPAFKSSFQVEESFFLFVLLPEYIARKYVVPVSPNGCTEDV